MFQGEREGNKLQALRGLIIEGVVVSLAFGVFFAPWIFGKACGWEDSLVLDWPLVSRMADSYANGEIPLWDACSYGGEALCGVPIRQWFYPGIILLGFLLKGLGVSSLSYGGYAGFLVFHFLCAYCGVSLFARTLGLERSWRILCGLGYALSACLVARFKHESYFVGMAWFPFLLHAGVGLCRVPCARHAGYFGIIASLLFLGTAPQHLFLITVAVILAMVTGWTCRSPECRAGPSFGGSQRGTLSLMVWLGTALVLAIGVAAIPYLFHFEWARFCGRFDQPFKWVDDGAAPLWAIWRTLTPFVAGAFYPLGPWMPWGDAREFPFTRFYEEAMYLGMVPWFGLLLYFLQGGWRTRRAAVLLSLLVFGVLWSLGEHNLLRICVRRVVSALATARNPTRAWFIAQLAVACLSTLAYRKFLGGDARPGVVCKTGGLLALLVLGGAFAGMWRWHVVPPSDVLAAEAMDVVLAALFVQMLLVAGVVGLLLMAGVFPVVKRWSPYALVTLLVCDSVWFSRGMIQGANDPDHVYAIPPVLAELRVRTGEKPGRVDARGVCDVTLRGVAWHLPVLQGYNNMSIARFGEAMELCREQPERYAPILDLYGVGWGTAPTRDGMVVYSRTNAYPKVWYCTNAVRLATGRMYGALAGRTWDLHNTVLLERKPGDKVVFPTEPQPGKRAEGDAGESAGSRARRISQPVQGGMSLVNAVGGKVRFCDLLLVDYRESEAVIWMRARTPGWLVINDHDAPGWRCSLDGVEVEYERAYGLFRAISIHPGVHVVRYWFWPKSLTRGLWIGIPSLLILCALLLWPREGDRPFARRF